MNKLWHYAHPHTPADVSSLRCPSRNDNNKEVYNLDVKLLDSSILQSEEERLPRTFAADPER